MAQINRFNNLAFLNGKVARNRIVLPPMASETATELGFVTDETLAHYKRLASAHAGIMIVEYSFVHASGRSEPNQLGIAEDAQIKGLTHLAELIHESDALAGIQLSHGGGKSSLELTGRQLMAPSKIAVPVKDRILEVPQEMDLDQILLWKKSFADAAARAALAGFDLVELHSAHGYGLNQWLSPLTNHRTDGYGGILRNRARLLLETVAAIQATVPNLLISVRMPGQDFLEGGLVLSEMVELAKHLEEAGVSILHVSSGIGGWRRPQDRTGEGYLVAEASEIQRATSLPVIGVGGIKSARFIDAGLKERRFSLAAVGRAILEDPGAFRLNCLQNEKREEVCF